MLLTMHLHSLKRFGDRFLLITQNIDNLHERAGSQRVIHMHGELLKFAVIGQIKYWSGKGIYRSMTAVIVANSSAAEAPYCLVW